MPFTNRINPLGLAFGEPGSENWADDFHRSYHLLSLILKNTNEQNRMVAGSYTAGVLTGVAVRYFDPATGAVERVSFANTPAVANVSGAIEVWYADRVSGLITAVSMPTYAALVYNKDSFPILITGTHQDTITTTATFAEMIAPREDARGDGIPLGTINAWNPGHYDINGAFVLGLGLVGNTIAEANAYLNPRGWYVCDGTALNLPESPLFNAPGRYLPNLSDSRFLMGSSVVGAVGGSNSSYHYHLIGAHYHGKGTLSITASGSHGHALGWGVTVGSSGYIYATNQSNGVANFTPTTTLNTHSHGSVDFTGAVGNLLGPNGDVPMASGIAQTENRPQYLSCFYIIKVI